MNESTSSFIIIDFALEENITSIETFKFDRRYTPKKNEKTYNLKNIQIIQNNLKLSLKEYNTDITIQVDYSKNRHFFGFGMFIYNTNYSLIHQLYYNKIIPSLNFGIYWNFNIKDIILFLGGLPNEYLNTKNPLKFKINQNCNNWGFNLKEIHFLNQTIIVNDCIYFSTQTNFIVVTKAFMDTVREFFFQEYYLSGDCFVASNNNQYYFGCEYCASFEKNIPVFRFVTEEHNFELKEELLYKTSSMSCLFLFSHNKETPDVWSLGTAVFKNRTIYFDYNDKTITFYRAEKKKFILEFQIIFCLNYIVLIYGIFHLILSKFYEH